MRLLLCKHHHQRQAQNTAWVLLVIPSMANNPTHQSEDVVVCIILVVDMDQDGAGSQTNYQEEGTRIPPMAQLMQPGASNRLNHVVNLLVTTSLLLAKTLGNS